MSRLIAIICLCASLTSCESFWLSAYRHQGGGYSHEDNLKWLRAHYYDAPLTRYLNRP